eukprot:NODE_7_length_67686_cov_1.621421.p19 type:complete len:295 gc:universal NODE_7_length_67686_cov_1.621421:214-1098(+)
MIICSWNVMSLRSALTKKLADKIIALNADIVCLQETKVNGDYNDNIAPLLYPFQYFHNCKARKGYSGTCVLSKTKPLEVIKGFDDFDEEGRVITLEYKEFFLVATYVPNAGANLKRLAWKLEWMDKFYNHLKILKEKKPVIWAGDLNVSHQPIDLANPKTNEKSAGFSMEERSKFGDLLGIPPITLKRKAKSAKPTKKKKVDSGEIEAPEEISEEIENHEPLNIEWVDAFRKLYPDKQEYSYFGFRTKAKERNVGWRLDYFVISEPFMNRVENVEIRNDYYGLSDHSPLLLTLK